MNKKLLILLLPVLLLVGCSDKIDQDYLMSQTWSVEFEKEKTDEMVMIAEFGKEDMTLRIDPDSISTVASNDMEELGMEIAKNMIAEMKYEIKYKLNGKKIHLNNKELDLDGDFDVSKKDNLITFTNQNTGVGLTLSPYKGKKITSKSKEEVPKSTSESSTIIETEESFKDVENIEGSNELTSSSSIENVITVEDLMADYPAWNIESGKTPAIYNEERRTEANRRLQENGLPADDDYINRYPVAIDRETEKAVYNMVGYPDYMPTEPNIVINGIIVTE